jgi:hypothetical protein
MDPNEEIEVDFSPFLVLYKSGRVQRFGSTSRRAPASTPSPASPPRTWSSTRAQASLRGLFLPKDGTKKWFY